MLSEEEAAIERPAIALDDPMLYFSRELSWLEFNDRVLEEALDRSNPLLERLKFVAIYGTNLDEFFMIRVAAIKQQIEAQVVRRSEDGRLPAEHLSAISERLRSSLAVQTRLLNDELLPALERQGIRIRRVSDLSEEMQAAMERTFDDRLFPVLTPLAVDSGHPFPYISNLSLSLAVELEEPTAEGVELHFARVKIPPTLPRFVPVDGAPEGERVYVLIEDLIAHHLDALFPGMTVREAYVFRVTRDADLDLQEDEADDLLRAIESELQRRRFGEPVRLGDRARHAGVHARFSAQSARSERCRLLRIRRLRRALGSVADHRPARITTNCAIRRFSRRFRARSWARPISSR